MPNALLQLSGVLAIAALPISPILEKIHAHFRHTYAKLDIPKPGIRFSKATLVWITTRLLYFFKGFGLLWVSRWILSEESWLIPISAGILILHLYFPIKDPLAKKNLWWIIWGMYSLLTPYLFWVFPLVSLILSLLFSTWELAVLATLGLLFALNFDLQQGTFMALQATTFGITFLAWTPEIFSHLETGNQSLLKKFDARK